MTRYFGVPLRNATSLGLGGTLALSTGAGSVPESLFAAGEQGAWYDPSDNSTMFQDAAGTTPVTAVEQAVGLILDKRFALGIGTEIVSNNTFATDTIWAKGTGWSIGSGVATKVAGSASGLSQAIALEANVQYRLVYTITRSAGSITPQLTGGSTVSGTARSAAGTYVDFLTAVSGNTTLNFSANATFAGTVDNVYLKRVSGNDAYQVTSASRPTLRARYNLLTYSEQLDNAAWTATSVTVTNSTSPVAPDGTATAETLTATGANGTVLQSITAIAGSHTFSVYLRRRTGTGNIDIQAGDGTYSTVTLTTDWQRFTVAATLTAGSRTPGIRIVTSGDAVDAWGAQLIRTDVFPPNTYQRIAAATDYDTSPSFPPFLEFDGTDDGLLTQSVDFTATDKVTDFVGVSKFTDSVAGFVNGLGVDGSNNGFTISAPSSAGANNIAFGNRGTISRVALQIVTTPTTKIITGIGNISGDITQIRSNGVVIQTQTSDVGTGNYQNAPLYVGRRSTTGAPLNGRLYAVIICGATYTTDQVAQTERWINNKMANMMTLP